ncbi:MAG: fumarylacetoacetate hydrolase family protein, partial [Pseudomonas sp.]
MKLATLKNGSRDGQLVVVSRDLAWARDASSVAPTLQQAIENWSSTEPRLQALSVQLNAGEATDAFAFDPGQAMAPLPRAYQ